MAHFAKVENGIVTSVIVAEQDFINSGAVGDPSSWVQTSYNTRGGVHYDPNTGQPDGGAALRKNYAGIGYTYDPVRDAFYGPKPYDSWFLNETTCYWEAPVPMPADAGTGEPPKMYLWDEEIVDWVERVETNEPPV
jgi:hypothetical protein